MSFFIFAILSVFEEEITQDDSKEYIINNNMNKIIKGELNIEINILFKNFLYAF